MHTTNLDSEFSAVEIRFDPILDLFKIGFHDTKKDVRVDLFSTPGDLENLISLLRDGLTLGKEMMLKQPKH
jgi:hypothetical protein